MKRLILVRHAKSSWKDLDCPDFDRPLTKRGKKDALDMGAKIKEMGARPSLIVSSPAKRALATMKRIVARLGLPEKMILRDESLYHAGSDDLLAFVQEVADSHEEAIVCGHNPGLADFCRYLTGTCSGNLPTCGVVVIDFTVESWNDVHAGSGRVWSFTSPRDSNFIADE